MQAELANQFAVFQSEREKMKQDWCNFTNSKDKEIETPRLKLLDAQKALDKVSRPGSSSDMPAGPTMISATGATTKVTTETIHEENDPKPPDRPGGHGGGGGGDGGDPGDPSDPGRARRPANNNNNRQNPGNPGGPNDPNPPDDHWEATSSSHESIRAPIGNVKNSKEAEKISSQPAKG